MKSCVWICKVLLVVLLAVSCAANTSTKGPGSLKSAFQELSVVMEDAVSVIADDLEYEFAGPDNFLNCEFGGNAGKREKSRDYIIRVNSDQDTELALQRTERYFKDRGYQVMRGREVAGISKPDEFARYTVGIATPGVLLFSGDTGCF